MSDPSRVLDEAYSQDGDPFAMSIPPPEGYKGYDYKPEQTPYQAFVRPLASSEFAKREPNWFGRNVLQPASKVPGLMEIAAFIGPKGAANLAKAGIRHPDDMGGINRLKAAQQDMRWSMGDDASRRAIWEAYGWAPETAWGTHDVNLRLSKPATALPTPKFDINDEMMRPMRSGKDTLYRGEGRFSDLTHGLDELFVAEPKLANVPTRLDYGPGNPTSGEAKHQALFGGGFKPRPTIHDVTGFETDHIRASGPTRRDVWETLLHEGPGHGAAVTQGLAVPDLGPQRAGALRGTRAERSLDARIAKLKQEEDAILQAAGGALTPEVENRLIDLRAQANIIRGLREQVPSYAHYLDLPPERLAREVYVRGLETDPWKDVPGLVDTYQPGTMGPGFSKDNLGLPLRAYDPKTIKRSD